MKLLEEQRDFFETDITKEYFFRIKQLKKLKKSIITNKEKLTKALYMDLGKGKIESHYTEIAFILGEIDEAIRHLKKWMRPEKVSQSGLFRVGKSVAYTEPKGIVLIISPWNYPVNLAFAPLIASMAAGNCSIVKPSELSPNTSAVIAKIISETFDSQYIACVEGGADVAVSLLAERFDHIFYTGGTKVGKIVMQAAAKNLTPVTLELGGKSPCIVDKSANLRKAALYIVMGKYINAGQTCIAPDYILVDKSIKKKFIKILIKTAAFVERIYPNDRKGMNIGKIISDRHFNRVMDLIDSGKIIYGGNTNKDNTKLSLTILDNVKVRSKVMQEEIFGPILPIIAYEDEKQLVKVIRHYEKPLACYIFTRNNGFYKRMIKKISFGGGCKNATLLHVTNSKMGFGGVGGSGMGSYHGYTGYMELSHKKSVMELM